MAKDEARGGEAISQMSQQELKIVTRRPNHGKWCLLQIASFFCRSATPARAGAAEVAGQSLPAQCDSGAAPWEPAWGFGTKSPSLSPGGSWWVSGHGVSVAEYLQRSADFSSGAVAGAAAGFVA